MEVRGYEHYDPVSFSDGFSHLPLHDIASIDDVNGKLDLFNDLVCSTLDAHIPI